MIIKLLPHNFNAVTYQECHDVTIAGRNLMFIGRQTVRNRDDTAYELQDPVKINTTVPYIIEEPAS